MASVFTVLTKLEADVSNFASGMAKAQASLDKLEKAVASTGGKMDKNLTKEGGKAAGALGKIKGAFGAAAAAGAAFAAVNYIQGLTKAASSFETEFIGVEQTFGEGADIVKAFAETAAYTAGISETSALRFSKSFGGFARSAGLAGEAQAGFSTSLVKLAGDLSSFYDTSPEEALAAISSGLRGEFEPLRKYNILLNDSALKQEAMNKGIYNGVGNLSTSTRVLAAHTAILNQAGIAQDDFTNFSDAYSNVMFTNQALMQNLSADLGTALLPAMARLAQAFTPIIENAGPRLEKAITAVVPVIEALINAIEPINEALNPLLDSLAPVMELFANAINQILPPFVEILGLITPIVNDLVNALSPLVNEVLEYLGTILSSHIVPILEVFASYIQTVVIPIIQALADFFGNYITPVLNGFAQIFEDVIGPAMSGFADLIESRMPHIQDTITKVFEGIGQAVEWVYNNILKPVFGGILDFMRDVLGIDIATEMGDIGKAFEKGFNEARNRYNNADLTFIGEDARFKAIEEGQKTGYATGTAVGKGLQNSLKKDGKGGKKAVDGFQALLNEFADDIKKQEAKIKLAALGLSKALIDKVLGTTDWESIYNRIIKGGAKAATDLQNTFNKTTMGIDEVAEALKKAQDELDEFNEKAKDFQAAIRDMGKNVNPFASLLDTRGEYERQVGDTFDNFYSKVQDGLTSKLFSTESAKKLNDIIADYSSRLTAVARAFDKVSKSLEDAAQVREAAKAFREGMQELAQSVLPLSFLEREIGRFESQVIQSFDAINTKISDGINIGLLTEAAGTQLRATASATRSTLNRIAKQRDELAKTYNQFVERLNATTEFRKATKEATLGYANITSLGTSARTILKNFEVMVKRTETFRQQLSTLNQMGLNRELYNQILSSGLDAGSATAKALLKGGPKAVAELNNLYAQLNMTADLMSVETTNVMFDGGESAVQGFIDGIIAQDEQLRLEAEQIATSFNDSFSGVINTATADLTKLIASLESQRSLLIDQGKSLAQAFNDAFQSALQVAIDAARPVLPTIPEKPKVDNSAAIAALDTKIANAQRYIRNINNDTKEAGATKKLIGYIEQRQALLNAASGGYIRGAGTGTSDSIPARLSNGEFVMSAKAVDKFGAGFMSALNSGRVPAFASGGAVGKARIVSGGGGKTVINNKYEINVRTGIGDPAAIGKQVVSAIAAYEKTSGRQIL